MINFLTYLNQLTVGCAIIFALIGLCLKPASGKPKDLEFIITRALAGSALPTAIALLLCAFKPEMLNKLEGASLNVAVAGITLLYISLKSIITSN